MKSLYDLLEYKKKNSLLKSVTLSMIKIDDKLVPYLILEAYDDTALKLESDTCKHDRFHEYLDKIVNNNIDKIRAYYKDKGADIEKRYDGEGILTYDLLGSSYFEYYIKIKK